MTEGTATVQGAEVKAAICTVGAGGCGCNQVAGIMRGHKPADISMKLIGVNTDQPHFSVAFPKGDPEIDAWRTDQRFHELAIGDGFGAGGEPDVAKEAMNAKLEEFKKLIGDADIVPILIGGGGGTGSGAGPVLAKCVKDAGKTPIAIVTMPLAFEGAEILAVAEATRDQLYDIGPTLLIYNDKLNAEQKRKPLQEAFAFVDTKVTVPLFDHLRQFLQTAGFMNRDRNDIRKLFKTGNRIYFGYALVDAEAGKDPKLDAVKVVQDLIGNQFQGGTDILQNASAALLWYHGSWFVDEMEAVQLGIKTHMPNCKSMRPGAGNHKDTAKKWVGLLVAAPVPAKAETGESSSAPVEMPIQLVEFTPEPVPHEPAPLSMPVPETVQAKRSWREREPADYLDRRIRSRAMPLPTESGEIVTFYAEPDVAKAWEELSRSPTATGQDFEELLKHLEIPREGTTVKPKIPANAFMRSRRNLSLATGR